MIPLIVLVFASHAGAAQQPPPGMTTYQMVFLESAAASSDQAEAESDEAQAAQLAYLARLNRERINLLYGPFLDAASPRGVAVLNVPDADTARRVMADDPHVKAGRFIVRVRPWLGPRDLFQLPADPPQHERLVFGLLVRGPSRSQPPEEAAELQEGHLAYMAGLGKQGKLLVAGPFLDDEPARGLVIYRVDTLDEARQLAANDPAVKAGRLAIEVRPWMTWKGILK